MRQQLPKGEKVRSFVRMSPELKERVAVLALKQRRSENALMVDAIERFVSEAEAAEESK